MVKKLNIKDYAGKKVFIGIDVHKRTYSIVALCEDVIVKKWSMEADVYSCIESLKKFFKGAEIFTVYEAGFSGYKLHRELIRAGICNIVISPASVQKAPNDRVKTDALDAKKMAFQLSKGLLKGIEVPTLERELRRELSRLRTQLVDHKTSVTLQIKSKLLYYGLMSGKDSRKITEKYLKEIEELPLSENLRFSIDNLIQLFRKLRDQIKEVEKKLKAQEAENKRTSEIYNSVPGVGLITATTLANELGDLATRFKNERELFSYTGLTPSEYSSGDSIKKGKISRCGPPRIRWILTEAAWICVKRDKNMREIYERIKGRRGAKRAIVAISRKLIGRIRSCFKNDCLYKFEPA